MHTLYNPHANIYSICRTIWTADRFLHLFFCISFFISVHSSAIIVAILFRRYRSDDVHAFAVSSSRSCSGVFVQLRYRFIQFQHVIRFVEKCIFAAILKIIRGANGEEFLMQLKLIAVNTFTYLKKKRREKKRETAKFTIRRRFVMGICWLCARFCVCVCVCVGFLPFSIFACSINISAFRLCDKYYKPFCC